jgi:sn-glycerol 3-phosphate transport system substrate-binding protein
VQAQWHQDTGYLPITLAAGDETKAVSGASTTKTPAPTSAVIQMTAKAANQPTPPDLRLGSFDQIRGIIDEELEAVWAGDKVG